MQDVSILPIMTYSLLSNLAMWLLLFSTISVYVLVVATMIMGVGSDKYNGITVPVFNPYYIATLLLFAMFFQEIIVLVPEYFGVRQRDQASALILIGALFLLLWAITFFHVGDVVVSIWTAAFLAVYQFILLFYFFYRSIAAALLVLFSVGLSIFLFYQMIHIASSNGYTVG